MVQPSTETPNRRPTAANRLPLIAMLTATAISGAGNAMTRLAIPWFVLETTGSASRTGIAGAAEAAPLVIAGLLGGTLVDRIGFRRMSIISDLASGITVAMIPLLHLTVGIEFWQLLALVFTGALLDAPGVTARRSFVPELADAAGMPLAAANGYFGAISRSTALVGPLVAGVFIAAFGAAPLLWVDAATFMVSAAIMFVAVPASLQPSDDGAAGVGSYWSNLVDGFRWIVRNPLVRTLVAMILLTNLIESPFLIVVTVYAREVFDSSVALGILLGVFSVGAIVGSMASGVMAERLAGRLIFPIGFSGVALLYVVMMFEPPLAVVSAAAFVTGLIAGPMNPFLDTVFQRRVPPGMRGRVFGLRSALMMSATPLGILAGGVLIEAAGLQRMLVIQLVAMLAVIGWMLVSPTLRRVDTDEP